MLNKNNYNVIYWCSEPIKVELGTFMGLQKCIGGRLILACYDDFPEERKQIGWNNQDYGEIELEILPKGKDQKIQRINILLEESNTIHIVQGLSGNISKILCPIMKKRNIQFFVISERPHILFDSVKSSVRSIFLIGKYINLRRKYERSVKAFLALGERGVRQYKALGWTPQKLFQFMYCGNYLPTMKKYDKNSFVRFLYIGRFSYTHGLDILMKAFECLSFNNWYLDMAGGYGDNSEEIKDWINKNERVSFLGQIPHNEVRTLMQRYDVVLVPSRMDGWNCQVNEALSVGTPVITMDEAVSAELVRYFDAGISVPNLKYKELSKAIDSVLENPEIIKKWQVNIEQSIGLISPDTVGNYLYNIINYSNNKIEYLRPICPWNRYE